MNEIFLNRQQIENILPHKGNNVFLEKAVVQQGVLATATLAEIPAVIESGQTEIPFFIILDGLAQTVTLVKPPQDNNVGVLSGIENMQINRRAHATEPVQFEANNVRTRSNFGKAHVVAKSEDEVLMEGTLLFTIVDKNILKQ